MKRTSRRTKHRKKAKHSGGALVKAATLAASHPQVVRAGANAGLVAAGAVKRIVSRSPQLSKPKKSSLPKIHSYKYEAEKAARETTKDLIDKATKYWTAYNKMTDNYPGLLQEYMWYDSLKPGRKEKVRKEYEEAGIDIQVFVAGSDNIKIPLERIVSLPNNNYSIKKPDGTQYYWSCYIPDDKKHMIDNYLSNGYIYSLPYWLHTGVEKHWLQSFNACGPGTKIDLRQSEYWPLYERMTLWAGQPVKGTYPWNEPINEADACCIQHDSNYALANNTDQKIQLYDWDMRWCMKHSEKGVGAAYFKQGLINATIKAKQLAGENPGSFGTTRPSLRRKKDPNHPPNWEAYKKRRRFQPPCNRDCPVCKKI
jgi:hypothetical protein